jgi:hypothetical protein
MNGTIATQLLARLTLAEFLDLRARLAGHDFTRDPCFWIEIPAEPPRRGALLVLIVDTREAAMIVDGLRFVVPPRLFGGPLPLPPAVGPSEHSDLPGAVDACVQVEGLREVIVGEVTLAPDHVSPITGRRQLRPLGAPAVHYAPVEHWVADRLADLLDGREAGTARDAVIAAVQTAADAAGLT